MIRLHLLFIGSSQYIIYIEHGEIFPLKFYTFIACIWGSDCNYDNVIMISM